MLPSGKGDSWYQWVWLMGFGDHREGTVGDRDFAGPLGASWLVSVNSQVHLKSNFTIIHNLHYSNFQLLFNVAFHPIAKKRSWFSPDTLCPLIQHSFHLSHVITYIYSVVADISFVFSRQNHHSLNTSLGWSRSSEWPNRLPRAWRAQMLWFAILPQGNVWWWIPPDTHKKEGLCLSWS